MLVSLDKKIIVLLPPKTASTSIQSAMMNEECMNIIYQHFNNDFKILNYYNYGNT